MGQANQKYDINFVRKKCQMIPRRVFKKLRGSESSLTNSMHCNLSKKKLGLATTPDPTAKVNGRDTSVITTSVMKAEKNEYPPGECYRKRI
jgi:hypothetical protein